MLEQARHVTPRHDTTRHDRITGHGHSRVVYLCRVVSGQLEFGPKRRIHLLSAYDTLYIGYKMHVV